MQKLNTTSCIWNCAMKRCTKSESFMHFKRWHDSLGNSAMKSCTETGLIYPNCLFLVPHWLRWFCVTWQWAPHVKWVPHWRSFFARALPRRAVLPHLPRLAPNTAASSPPPSPGKKDFYRRALKKLHVMCATGSWLRTYSLHSKIFALFDFSTSRLTISLIQKNYENVIYFTMVCFIIIYILSISIIFTFS
jgi:hypothetical protein